MSYVKPNPDDELLQAPGQQPAAPPLDLAAIAVAGVAFSGFLARPPTP